MPGREVLRGKVADERAPIWTRSPVRFGLAHDSGTHHPRGVAMLLRSKSTIAGPLARGICLSALIGVSATTAAAADQIFLKLDGIRGASTDARHKDEIDITSYAQAFRNTANFGFGGGGGSGRVSCGDITVLKTIDRSSPDLIMHVTTGRHIRDGVITFRTGGERLLEYYTVHLRDILIDAVEQVDPPGDAGLTEKISLKVRQFSFTFVPQDAKGQPGTPVTFGWDCASNSRL
jgi:type VI secretion system secreted protein Hcp